MHEMSNLFSVVNKRSIINLSSAEFAHSMTSSNLCVLLICVFLSIPSVSYYIMLSYL